VTRSEQPPEGSDIVPVAVIQTAQTGAGNERSRQRPNLSRWFWRTIVLLLVVTLALNLLAAWQAGRKDGDEATENGDGDRAGTNATQVEQWLNTAGTKAEAVRGQIDSLLDTAYAPVYEGIPAYMDFHYSLKGEWLELGAAALGNIGDGLEKHLFVGLASRVKLVAEELERDFDVQYQVSLDAAMTEVAEEDTMLVPLVTGAMEDAKKRMSKTAGTVGTVAVGGASLKALTKVFAKNLGTKLATKVAAKTGTKWVAVASGAGTGAGVCSWTGPGAAGCAVVGAVITWIGVDLAMLKLDEYVTRDDFEQELRMLIESHKDETRRALEVMLDGKRQIADSGRKLVVQEVSLSELEDADKLIACEGAKDILARYEPMLKNLQPRSPANVEALRIALEKLSEDHLLAPWVEAIETAVANEDFRPWVYSEITLNVDLPPELREKRGIRARLLLEKTHIDFAWVEGVSAGSFVLSSRPEDVIRLKGPQRLELELVQDRGWPKWNRSFFGTAMFDVYETLAVGSGLMPKAKISLTVSSEGTEGPMPRATLTLPLSGVSLASREMPEFCRK
jgi:hypothetical protein